MWSKAVNSCPQALKLQESTSEVQTTICRKRFKVQSFRDLESQERVQEDLPAFLSDFVSREVREDYNDRVDGRSPCVQPEAQEPPLLSFVIMHDEVGLWDILFFPYWAGGSYLRICFRALKLKPLILNPKLKGPA